MNITRVDPLPTIVICCPPDELDARLAALIADLFALTTTGTVATGEARLPAVAEAEAVECPA